MNDAASGTDTTLVHAGTFAVLGADGGVGGRRGTSPTGCSTATHGI